MFYRFKILLDYAHAAVIRIPYPEWWAKNNMAQQFSCQCMSDLVTPAVK